MRKLRKTGILKAILFSILIGITIMWLVGGSLDKPFKTYLWNFGYSISIGLPLFANGYLFGWFEKRYIDWVSKPVKSVFFALLMHLGYSSFVIFTVNWFWFHVVHQLEWKDFWAYNRWTIISEYIIFIIVASIIYATSFFRAWRFALRESERLKSEAMSLKYKVLQDQVNPHFLFNSLNVLGSLIDIDTEKAKTFTRELSMFYRDVLHLKDQELIEVDEEIDFVRKYIYLQHIRFGEALEVTLMAKENTGGKVIPLSLQALVENAIKHNEVSKAKPLKILITLNDSFQLIVENNLQVKNAIGPGSQTGLKNLAGRYEFLTGKNVEIIKNEKYFRVVLPLIQVNE